MAGISDLIQTMGAIIIFSLILLTANRIILSNSVVEVETEAEKIAVQLAQSIIKEAQTKPFDAEVADGTIPTILPEGFSSCGPSSTEDGNRDQFNDFDDYHTYSGKVDTKLGQNSFILDVDVLYVTSPNFDITYGSETNESMYKKMMVTVTSDYLQDTIRLSYLRRYYKTKN